MINYVYTQYKILLESGYKQAADGSWHLENEFDSYQKSRKTLLSSFDKLTRQNMLNIGYLTNDFVNYYSSAESFLKKMNE